MQDSQEFSSEDAAKHNASLGKRGEDAAVRYLELRDYEIVERNWSCRFGEADIIARDGDALVFVEVKTRSSIDHGFPEEAVTPTKRAKYEKIAAMYSRECNDLDIPLRFDVIAILVTGSDRALLRHHINAFGQGD